jgi:hypothetical protein
MNLHQHAVAKSECRLVGYETRRLHFERIHRRTVGDHQHHIADVLILPRDVDDEWTLAPIIDALTRRSRR